jgi:hypothetical protein
MEVTLALYIQKQTESGKQGLTVFGSEIHLSSLNPK